MIEIDLTGKEVGDSIHFGSIVLPKGVKSSNEDESFTIAAITAPSALKSKEGESAGEEEVADEAEESGEEEKAE